MKLLDHVKEEYGDDIHDFVLLSIGAASGSVIGAALTAALVFWLMK